MSILDRIRNRKKQQEPSPMPGQAPIGQEQEEVIPASGDVNTPDAVPAPAPVSQPTKTSAALPNDFDQRDAVMEPVTSLNTEMPAEAKAIPNDDRPEWAKLSYEELVKKNPNWSRGQYAYELAKWRRENGQPDMSYTEWTNILKGHDPYETEAERTKRERNHRIANSVNAMGSFINALVNYNRVKRGHVGYTPDDGSKGYSRLQRMREAQRQTARINANTYLDAMGKDRAERAKAEAQAAAAATAQRNYDLKKAELQFKLDNAANEEARRNAAAELKKLEFEHKKDMDERKLKETARHNRQMEANGRSGKTSGKYIELSTSKGNKRYEPEKDGSNWIHKAYQDMLKEPDGKKYEVFKMGGLVGSSAPTDAEMYDAITRYNADQWKNRYRSDRYKGGGGTPPPLE